MVPVGAVPTGVMGAPSSSLQLALEVEDDALRGALADAGGAADGEGVARDDGARQVRRSEDAQDGERRLGADLAHADEHLEEAASLLRGEPVELEVVLADDEVSEQADLLAGIGHRAQVVGGDERLDEDAAHADNGGVRGLAFEGALDAGDDAHRWANR